MGTVEKKLFKHGSSYAVDIPKEFVNNLESLRVIIESCAMGLNIRPKTEIDTIEADPLFPSFIKAIAKEALENPEKLHDVQEVWDDEWDELLEGVKVDEV